MSSGEIEEVKGKAEETEGKGEEKEEPKKKKGDKGEDQISITSKELKSLMKKVEKYDKVKAEFKKLNEVYTGVLGEKEQLKKGIEELHGQLTRANNEVNSGRQQVG